MLAVLLGFQKRFQMRKVTLSLMLQNLKCYLSQTLTLVPDRDPIRSLGIYVTKIAETIILFSNSSEHDA